MQYQWRQFRNKPKKTTFLANRGRALRGRGGRRHTHLERTEERFVHVHHGTRIVKLAAIVRRREDRDELPIREKLIAVLDDLHVYGEKKEKKKGKKVRYNGGKKRMNPQQKKKSRCNDRFNFFHVRKTEREEGRGRH